MLRLNISTSHENNGNLHHRKKPLHPQTLFIKRESPSKLLGEAFCIFRKYVKIFDLYFVATVTVPDDKLLHASAILYQYIDNDDDGVPDNLDVYKALVETKATMIMFENENELDRYALGFFPLTHQMNLQDLQADETVPNPTNPKKFDAAFEKCFRLLCTGYAKVYPDLFGFWKGSHISQCYKNAISKHIIAKSVVVHNKSAWDEYYEKDNSYCSQLCEYMFWALTSMLGAHQKRRKFVVKKWKLYRRQDVEKEDPLIYALLTDPKFAMAQKLPIPIWHESVKRTNESFFYQSFKEKKWFRCCFAEHS